MLPALAEQLDVALDELLSGRKPALQTAAPSEAFSAGLVCRSMRAQGICTILAAALSLLGLAGLFILRYEYLNPSAGVFCAGIFLIFSAALESASFFWPEGILPGKPGIPNGGRCARQNAGFAVFLAYPS